MSPDSPLRLIIAAGGTGGHVLPAVAVLRELDTRRIPLDVLWVGGTDGIESDAAHDAGVRFIAIPTGKLRRYLDVKTARDAINIPRGIILARGLVRSFRPDVVFSTGGFVSVPTVFASRGRAPVLTHEQTTVIGLANKINIRSANVAAMSFEQTAAQVSRARCKVVVTGNPIRSELLDGNAERGRMRLNFIADLPIVFVTGGARGASPLNHRIEAILRDLLETTQVIHQTGPMSANSDYARLSNLRSSLPDELADRYVVTEFIRDEIADVYAMADLVVCRAGAGTIAELTSLGKAAIMIPLPLSGGGEQITNARALSDHSAGVVLMQDSATPDRIRSEIRELLDNPARRTRIAAAATSIGRPDAAARLADELLALANYSPAPSSSPR
jgi:UDP-N-acetylglucosamine--N-acetylmuramyl-(pentapeptide) pyrophosphoryl-undecaprenol N-acetylglucosamine transferase